MRVKLGNQKAARYVKVFGGYCQQCTFYSESLSFCVSMNCAINGSFYRIGTSEDIFKL